MTTAVFVGPTLPAAEVTARLPDAVVMPPVSVGDVLALSRRRSIRRIAIIDGYFERMAAVWHKEILVAMERGIEMLGAASMGAIRAAELAPYGMVGVGAIFKAFAHGDLVADDEVAVAHLPAEMGYRAVSDALVNLRDGLARAARGRVIAATTRDRLVEIARGRFYRERSWDQLVRDGRAAGVARRELDALMAWRDRVRPDRKADDARLLLRALATPRRVAATRTTRRRRRAWVPRTWAFRQLDRGVR
jgi:hypothetical protein